MQAYRFIGFESSIGTIGLKYFGQRVTLEEKVAKDAVRCGCALVPAEQFDQIGFTSGELRKYMNPGSHTFAPPEFSAKKDRALTLFRELRDATIREADADKKAAEREAARKPTEGPAAKPTATKK